MNKIKKFFSTLGRWIDSVNNFMLIVSGFAVILMMLATSYEVVSRYFFRAPTAWSLELSENLMVATVFLGAGFCCLIDGHVNIDLIYSRMRPVNKLRMDVFSTVAGLLFVTVVCWQLYLYFLKLLATGETSSEAMFWVLWPILLVATIGSFLFLLQLIVKLFRAIDALRQIPRTA